MNKVACFTGHRFVGSNPLSAEVLWIKTSLEDKVFDAYNYGYTTFISGGALGVDTWGAEAVLSYKDILPDIRLVIARPFVGQETRWRKEDRDKYTKILDMADEVVTINGGSYEAWKMLSRNKWMVNNSELVIAVFNGVNKGGTYHCISYARKLKKPIYIINPSGRSISQEG